MAVMMMAIAGCNKDNENKEAVEVIAVNGDIQAGMDRFRSLLGPLNTGGAATDGRREVNWDGVPEDMLGKPLPEDFFNPVGASAVATRQRGLVYTSRAGTFAVSKKSFEEVNILAAGSFKAFSGANVFANISNNLWEVGFQVPGKALKAGVAGFGAVFSDVDHNNESYLELFNESRSLGRFFIPAHNDKSTFSFLGIYFKNGEKITRIEVSHPGSLVSGKADVSQGGPDDLIVLDDFIYAEPEAQIK